VVESGKSQVIDKSVKGSIVFIGIAILSLVLPILVREITQIYNWSSSGFVLCSIREHHQTSKEDVLISFWGVENDDFLGLPYPVRGDTILTLDGIKANHKTWLTKLESPHEPGKEVPVTFKHNGENYKNVFKTRPVKTSLFISVLIQQILKLLIFLSFIIVGFWAFRKRPDSIGVRSLALYCFSMAAFMGTTYMPMYPVMASFQIPFELPWKMTLRIIAFCFSSFWLCMHMVFPRHSRLFKKSPMLTYAVCFAPTFILIILNTIFQIRGFWFGMVTYAVILGQVIAGLLILRHHYVDADNNLERRQTKLVFWGSGIGVLLFVLYMLDFLDIVPQTKMLHVNHRLIFTNIIFLIMLASPISFAYAFGRYRLLEVEGRLKRGTQYLFFTGILLAIFFALMYVIGEVLLQNIGITQRTPTLMVALALAFGFAPAQRTLSKLLEARLFPERKQLKSFIKEFLQHATGIPDRETLCGHLEDRLQKSLGVKSAYAIIRSNGMPDLTISGNEPVPFEHDQGLMAYLEVGRHPVLLDEAMASSQVDFTDDERAWMIGHDIALILPLFTREKVTGLLALSHKFEKEDFTSEELQILTTLSSHLTLALENLRLLEENVEKHRLEEQLQIARKVQEGFLPQEIPETPGLEITGGSTFSLEVAGDYYDVIPVDNGRTVLAIGDVSGKGAGAAMIMANLQASLRALCGVGLELDKLVTQINDIIYRNTDSEQYITFFVGIFDPSDNSFNFVNAGHNHPLIARKDGTLEMLEAGGLILGALTNIIYNQGKVILEPEDLLFLYTDGLSEAMNLDDEEFGETRIRDRLISDRSKPIKDIMDNLINDISKFSIEGPPGDDLTLLVARVKS